ncbi:hypothetical protein PCC8801_3204 [Rippkaea orientalis PCC 8801]|uniref:PEP-CTERM protein-sorting domain-containing protein n=1 Tax=Rippkaea orientalis (strain PCC 8801 / RF-1) TaxID=41431 RepID=B7JY79_RIPO1|nr:PEP-CTERM sorting domain-containing protein [Rippkaea orientalis]ACK67181.1 hypothetical protein PCC8801_3204 [Rippkaea orientalis PCC 8801]
MKLSPVKSAIVLGAASLSGIIGFTNVANAATFGFSFSNVNGPVGGTVEGTIELGDGDGTFAATSVIVTSAPAALGYTEPFDILANFTTVLSNTFTVTGGMINSAASSFAACSNGCTSPASGLLLNFPGVGTALSIQNTIFVTNGVLDSFNSTLSYSSTGAVPEPLTMLGAGAAVAFGGVFKKKLAAKKDNKKA